MRRLSGIHAETKAMYMSGYADLAIEGRSLQHAIVVTKPVDLTALARKIRQALQGQVVHVERLGEGLNALL